MKHDINLSWKKGMAFETEIFGQKLRIDVPENMGGENSGHRPKPLMLAALAGCTGLDVISILKKMRVEPDDFNINVEGELTDEHPKQYKSMHVTYEFWGKDLPKDKIEKAVKLSDEQYCGVSALYKKAIPITSSIVIYD
jgi:putative redox protein